MASDNLQAIANHYQAMASGDRDLETAARLLAPNIEWVEPSLPGQPPRIVHGRDAVVREVWQTLGSDFDEVRIEVDELLDAGDAIVALGAFRGQAKEGRPLDVSFVHVWKMRDGQAIYMRTYADTAAFMVAQGMLDLGPPH